MRPAADRSGAPSRGPVDAGPAPSRAWRRGARAGCLQRTAHRRARTRRVPAARRAASFAYREPARSSHPPLAWPRR